MMPKQMPDLTADLGIQNDARKAIKWIMRIKRLQIDELQAGIEKLCYDVYMRAIMDGQRYGYHLAEKEWESHLLEQKRYYTKQIDELKKQENGTE